MSAPLSHPVTADAVPLRTGTRVDRALSVVADVWKAQIARLPDLTPLRYFATRDGVTALSIIEVVILPGGFDAFGGDVPVPTDVWREGLRLAADMVIPFIIVVECDGTLYHTTPPSHCRLPIGHGFTNVPAFHFARVVPLPRLAPKPMTKAKGRR